MGLEQILLALSVAMFFATALAWRWSVRLRNRLAGEYGYELADILAIIIGLSLLARVVGMAAIALFDRSANPDTTLVLALVSQIMGGAIFAFAAYRVWRLSRKLDDDPNAPTIERGEALEGVGVKVDQVRAGATVAVDDPDVNAAVSGAYTDPIPPKAE